MHPGDALNACERVEQQRLVVVHVAHHHLELVVGVLAGDQQALQHLGQQPDGRLKIFETLRCVAIHGDIDQRHQAQAQLPGVQQSPVAADQTRLFKRPHPAQAGRGRQANAVGQVLVGDAALLLQYFQYVPVVAVQFHRSAKK